MNLAQATAMALAALVGIVVGYRHRVATLVVVLVALIIGGTAFGLSVLQTGVSLLMVQVGYVACSFLRTSTLLGSSSSSPLGRQQGKHPAAGHSSLRDR
jgi:hypothetical protein